MGGHRNCLVALFIAGGALGCGSEHVHDEGVSIVESQIQANKRAETDLHLVDRIYLDNGNAVEFYEPTPGFILVSEVIGAGTKTVLGQLIKIEHKKPSEIYALLAPERAVPEAITAPGGRWSFLVDDARRSYRGS